jgi:mercuric ion transport protein
MRMRRALIGGFLAVTGFLACPCHLVITLPLAAALLGGTALGGWIATHQGAILVGATIYFIGALAGGATLLLAGKGALASTTGQPQDALGVRAPRSVAADCCTPTGSLSAPAGDVPVEKADTAPAGGLGGVELTRH